MLCRTVHSNPKLQLMIPQQSLTLIHPMTQNGCNVKNTDRPYQTGTRLASIPFILQSVINARIAVKLWLVLKHGSAGRVMCIQWLKKLIHKRTFFLLEAGCTVSHHVQWELMLFFISWAENWQGTHCIFLIDVHLPSVCYKKFTSVLSELLIYSSFFW